MARQENPVLVAYRNAASPEDALTEAVAQALRESSAFRRAYAQGVLGEYARAQGWPEPVIESIDTQVNSYVGGTPDMQLSLKSGQKVLVEHKIRAPQTIGVGETGTLQAQLDRYLRMPVDAVVYVRANAKVLPDSVLSDPKYVPAPKFPHFLWRDIYDYLQGEDTAVMDLREAFEQLGFTPLAGDLDDLDAHDATRRQAAAKLLNALWVRDLMPYAARLGWKWDGGDGAQAYLLREAPEQVFFNHKQGRLQVSYTPPSERELEGIRARLELAAHSLPYSSNITVKREVRHSQSKGARGQQLFFRVSAPAREIFVTYGRGDDDATAAALQAFVTTFVDAVS